MVAVANICQRAVASVHHDMALCRYTLRIRARNEAGLSEAAEVTVRTGPTVPGGGIEDIWRPLPVFCDQFRFGFDDITVAVWVKIINPQNGLDKKH